MKRVAEAMGNNNVVLKTLVRNRNQQKWTFDGKTKTIKSVTWSSYSLNIQSNGASTSVIISTTSARWW
jgi:hypothetical protein